MVPSVEDLFLAVLTLENDVVIQAEYTISAVGLANWHVQGKRGTITTYGNLLKIYRHDPIKRKDPTKVGSMQPGKTMNASNNDLITKEKLEGKIYGDEIEIYGDVALELKGQKSFAVTTEKALELSRVLDGIRTSAAENRVIEFF